MSASPEEPAASAAGLRRWHGTVPARPSPEEPAEPAVGAAGIRREHGTVPARVVQGGRRVKAADGSLDRRARLVPAVFGGGGGMSKVKKERRTREEARRMFEATGRDKNQTLDEEEVKVALRGRGLQLGDAEFSKLFCTMDTNGDGRIDFVEFERALVDLDEGGNRWELEMPMRLRLAEFFATMDVDKDGVLDEDERENMRGELARLLMELGMSPKALDGVGGGLSLDAFRRQVEREREIALKEQGLLAAELVRAVAECIPRGCAESPMEGLEMMSEKEVSSLCKESVLPAVERALMKLRSGLREQAMRRKEAQDRASTASNPKFATSTAKKGGVEFAQFGKLDDFHEGIAQIGLPNPRLMEGMESEHCRRGDSGTVFSPGNYDTRTCSAAEWRVVTDPAKGAEVSVGPRRVRKVDDIAQDHIVKRAGLRREEVLALQLYTGPMFYKVCSSA